MRFANGFYYLGIVDYPNPAPGNNVFIHTHRKVVIDSYNIVNDQAYFKTCNPAMGEYYISHDNTLNMLFLTTIATKNQPETGVMTETECGINESGCLEVFTAGQLVPELMLKKRYRFAIERDRNGYILEVSGCFVLSARPPSATIGTSFKIVVPSSITISIRTSMRAISIRL